MARAARSLLWASLAARSPSLGDDAPTGLGAVWRFARRCEQIFDDDDDHAFARVDATFCDAGPEARNWDARDATTDEVACRAIASHLYAADPRSIRRAADCCRALAASEPGWPGPAAAARARVRTRYASSTTRSSVAAHVVDALAAAFGDVALGRGGGDAGPALALLGFADRFGLDDWRLPLRAATGAPDECSKASSPKLAEAFAAAFAARGAAADVVARAEEASRGAANAAGRWFSV